MNGSPQRTTTPLKLAVAAIACVAIALQSRAAHGQEVRPIPAWLVTEMTHLVADGGRWVTDNSEFKSANEPWDQYALEWDWGIGKRSITGRLYGLQNGRDVATFWQFRMYWHPGRNEGVLVQYGGDGTLGEGVIRSTGGVETESIQTFFAPDGTDRKNRHVTTTTTDVHDTRSFDLVGSEWQPRRRYIWHRGPR